jgi:UDP-GlcNAc:undecaprenyl-phosphate GlcNAc-1-phosphate transferase
VVFDLRLLSHLGTVPSMVLSMLWILTLMNSLNFLDNMDGLAAGVALIVTAIFALAAMRDGQLFVPTCCGLLVGALAGFLPFNFHPASIYMGDAGSLVIGLLLAVFTILTTFADPARGQQPIGALAPLVVMAVPLYDTASVIFLRWRIGVPIWTGDRRHFSHRLVRRGMSVPQAVIVIWLATLVTALPALLLPTASWPLAWGIAVQTLLVVALVALLESAGSSRPESGESRE